jgi:hypothetical protein
MSAFLTLKKLLSMFKRLNLSSLPSTNPGSGNPWLHSSGSIVVGAFAGGGSITVSELDGTPSGPATQIVFPNGTVSLVGGVATITGLQGPQGVQGIQGNTGATGPAGPNSIGLTTATTLNGFLLGNGSTVVVSQFGSAAGTVCQGNDARLSDARTPTAHNHDASAINAGTLDDARLSANVARRNAANNLVGLQTVSEGVTNTATRLSDDGIEFSRAVDGAFTASILRGGVSTPNSIALDYESAAGHYFRIGAVTRAVVGTAAIATTGGVFSVNTLAVCSLWTPAANAAPTITIDDAVGSALGFVTNRTNRSASGANAIQTWQYAGTERARMRTDGGFEATGQISTLAAARVGSFTIATLPTAAAGLTAYASDAATIAFATASQWRYSPSLPIGTAGFFVPVGGTTGQALVKSSNGDGDTEWATIGGGGGSPTDLSIANRTSTTLDVLSSTGTDVTLPEASTTQAGLLNATDKTKLSVAAFTFRLDGGGVAITTGAKKVLFRVPFACTITSWELVADVAGSIVLDLWRDTYSSFPPANADSITGSAKPTLTASDKAQSSTLTGWSTSLAAGDYIEIEVESAATITVAVLTLNLSRA